MAGIIDIDDLRLAFQATDETVIPDELVQSAIDVAHGRLERWVSVEHWDGTPEQGLVRAETLLAGAELMRALASSHAIKERAVRLAGQQVKEGDRFRHLMQAAESAERCAWMCAEPYMLRATGPVPGDVTPTREVLGR